MTKWSEEAWCRVEEIYEKILQLPFVKELTDGTLPLHKFSFYISQDSLYIREYTRVLAHIGSRIGKQTYINAFLDFAKDGVAVEESMHQHYLKGLANTKLKMSPTCMLYTDFLKSQSYNSVEVEAASVLPCFWIYQKVGEKISCESDKSNNPYSAWIETYDDPLFAESTKRAIDICDKLAENASQEVREQMLDIFETAAKLEWMFWHSAYSLEKWKV